MLGNCVLPTGNKQESQESRLSSFEGPFVFVCSSQYIIRMKTLDYKTLKPKQKSQKKLEIICYNTKVTFH